MGQAKAAISATAELLYSISYSVCLNSAKIDIRTYRCQTGNRRHHTSPLVLPLVVTFIICHLIHASYDPLWANITSVSIIHRTGSTNVLHCRQKRTERRPQVTCTENFVKFGHVAFRDTSGQTDRHTGAIIAIVRTPIGTEVKIHSVSTLEPWAM